MRILLLAHAFNSLTQRLWVELAEAGHQVSLEFDISDAVTIEALDQFRPRVLVASFLKRRLPEAVWRRLPCLVVHPGPAGDRGPSSLDWAVQEGAGQEGAGQWGVTVLQAAAELDGGDVWASETFPLRPHASKASLYRHEVTEGAVRGVMAALAGLAQGAAPQPLAQCCPGHPLGRWRPLLRQESRAIDWSRDDTATVLRKIQAADGVPGVRDGAGAAALFLHHAHLAPGLGGVPGTLVARAGPAAGGEAVARATVDGAVWLSRLRRVPAAPEAPTLKLPAVQVLGAAAAALPVDAGGPPDLWYTEADGVGTLHFPFCNGALSPLRARRLAAAVAAAQARPIRVLVLAGGDDFWCNGIDLNAIEAAPSPADASWEAIQAMDDLALAVISTPGQITVAALAGNAGAGGVFLALAADQVWARRGVVLNPHYKGMGNLYGSEYWTYLLPRRCGADRAHIVTQARLPMGTAEAHRLGLVDAVLPGTLPAFHAEVSARTRSLARDSALPSWLADKARRRAADEAQRPLTDYRAAELAEMRRNFYGFDPSYHVARYNFVFKVPKSRTPFHYARHRVAGEGSAQR